MDLKPGMLLQYKTENYGWYWKTMPRKAFEKHTQEFLVRSSSPRWWEMKNAPDSMKKFGLMLIRAVEIYPKVLRVPGWCSIYLFCWLTNPYLPEDVQQVWVDSCWVEPRTLHETHEGDMRDGIKRLYLDIKKEEKEQKVTIRDCYLRMKKEGSL